MTVQLTHSLAGGKSMVKWLCNLLAAAAFVAPAASYGATCTEYLQANLDVMKEGAKKCGISAANMATFPNTNPPVDMECGKPIDSRLNQLQSFQQCARVYYCGGRALQCALKRVPAGESALGSQCKAVQEDCLRANPVPR